MDRNGYNPSILSKMEECYITKISGCDLVRHEVYFGVANRPISKREGFWVLLVPRVHQQVHSDRELDLKLKRECQERYELTHSREEFMELIGRSYL